MKQGRISFPLTKAIAFSARSVRLRLGRTLVVVMGVASAIAFVTVLVALASVMTAVRANIGEKVGDMQKLYWWWVVVAALIALAGITNAILMSVTERIKEIGTIRCLGAMSRHIIVIFLCEAMFLGLVGGFIGGVLGLVGTYAYAVLKYGWGLVHGAVSWWNILAFLGAGIVGSMLLCVVSAIYPVYFAARLEPADAMRYEV